MSFGYTVNIIKIFFDVLKFLFSQTNNVFNIFTKYITLKVFLICYIQLQLYVFNDFVCFNHVITI